MKKVISLLVAAAAVLALMTPAMAATPSFPDVSDPTVSTQVDSLRMLGIVGGDANGNFRPGSTLTRAEFCVMAVNAMGNANQVALYSTRTIFPDVRSNHWARGYINLAAAGENKIIAGTDKGTFEPDSPITYGQAVTILIRVLGYTNEDTGMLWPDGFIALAERIGLSDGLTGLTGSTAITRAQAARLFSNLLSTQQKEGGIYAEKLGELRRDTVVLALDVTADDGTPNAIRTSSGAYPVANGISPQSIVGKKGALLLNKKSEILTFIPDRTVQKTVVVSKCDAGWLMDSDGTRYTIDAKTPAYTSEGTGTYGDKWVDLGVGSTATMYLNGGKVTGVYLSSGTAEDAVVVRGTASEATFARLTNGAANYKIYKNGQEISMSEIQPYDVATYDNGILRVSDLRITALYENAAPNESSPSSLTVFGTKFPVLSCAMDDAAKFKIGSTVTLLLTADGAIAGVESPNTVRGNAVGVVTKAGGTSATVKLLGGNLTIEASTSGDAGQLQGQLVNVSSYQVGKISLSRIYGNSPAGNLQVKERRLGTNTVSAGAALYERVGTTGAVKELTFGDLEGKTSIPASKIAYYHMNANRQVDILVFSDVTGDCYEYGFLKEGTREESSVLGDIVNRTASVKNRENPEGGTEYITGYAFQNGQAGGVAAGLDGKLAGLVTLNELKKVPRSAFYTYDGKTYLSFNGVTYPVAEQVQCYNRRAKSWFETLNEARAFSDDLTVYYDSTGGKVRMVVAN